MRDDSIDKAAYILATIVFCFAALSFMSFGIAYAAGAAYCYMGEACDTYAGWLLWPVYAVFLTVFGFFLFVVSLLTLKN